MFFWDSLLQILFYIWFIFLFNLLTSFHIPIGITPFAVILEFRNEKKQWDFSIISLPKIVFQLKKRYVIYKIGIFRALKIALKNRWKPWFYWLCGYVMLFDHSSHLDWTKSMPDEAGYPLVWSYFSKKCCLLFLWNNGNKKIWNGCLLLSFQILFFSLSIILFSCFKYYVFVLTLSFCLVDISEWSFLPEFQKALKQSLKSFPYHTHAIQLWNSFINLPISFSIWTYASDFSRLF